jgi:hypothetical protein
VIDFLNPEDLISLRAFGSLNDVELDLVAFFEALIALALDGAVVHEDVGATLAAEESVSLCVVEPLYGAFILCQWSDSLAFVSEPAVPRSESPSTVTGLTECDAKGRGGVFWKAGADVAFC